MDRVTGIYGGGSTIALCSSTVPCLPGLIRLSRTPVLTPNFGRIRIERLSMTLMMASRVVLLEYRSGRGRDALLQRCMSTFRWAADKNEKECLFLLARQLSEEKADLLCSL